MPDDTALGPVIIHTVLFKWRPDAQAIAIAAAMNALMELKDKIPGIEELSCGANFSDRSVGYQAGLVVRFTNRAALDAYGPHPAHQAVVTGHIGPIRAETIVVDYEAPSAK